MYAGGWVGFGGGAGGSYMCLLLAFSLPFCTDTSQRRGRGASLEREHFYCWPRFNTSPNNNLFNLFLSIACAGR